jgi:hypothetical protein
LLLAAASETRLIRQLCEALPTDCPRARPPLAASSAALRQRLLLTLLFLGAVGVSRTWDLRGYTADGLALLDFTQAGVWISLHGSLFVAGGPLRGAERLTDALARWTTQLWHAPDETPEQPQSLTCYIDGLSLPVYTDGLIPRGLVGRLSTALGAVRWCCFTMREGIPCWSRRIVGISI